jgi:hypothetical protein
MKYGRVLDGKVIETFTPLPGFRIEDSFSKSIVREFILIDESVEAGDEYIPLVLEEESLSVAEEEILETEVIEEEPSEIEESEEISEIEEPEESSDLEESD